MRVVGLAAWGFGLERMRKNGGLRARCCKASDRQIYLPTSHCQGWDAVVLVGGDNPRREGCVRGLANAGHAHPGSHVELWKPKAKLIS